MALPPSPITTLPSANDPILLSRIVALEARLAALEQVISAGPAGVTINASNDLRLSVNRDCLMTVGRNLTINVGGAMTAASGTSMVLDGGDTITIKTGSATIQVKKSGDVDITGSRISVKASGDLVMKGSKILQN